MKLTAAVLLLFASLLDCVADVTNITNTPWDTTKWTNGVYEIRARVYDAAGNWSLSPGVTVIVSNYVAPPPPPPPPPGDTVKPTVQITSPADGTRVKPSLMVRAVVSDNKGVVNSILLLDGIWAGESSQPTNPYWSMTTTKWKKGEHTLTVVAIDAAKNAGEASVTVIK